MGRATEFIEFINKETEIDLDYFFQQYLFDRKPPVFDYYQNDSTFHYKWSRSRIQMEQNISTLLQISEDLFYSYS